MVKGMGNSAMTSKTHSFTCGTVMSFLKFGGLFHHFVISLVHQCNCFCSALLKSCNILEAKVASFAAEKETVEHLLFLCPWTKHVWFGGPLGLKFSKWSMKRCEIWLNDLLHDNGLLDDYGKSLFATTCWWIWKKRCNWVFRGEMLDAREVICLVLGQVEEFWRSKNQTNDRNNRVYKTDLVRHTLWVKPPPGTVKFNIDGSFFVATGEAGIGLVGRNNSGDFVGGLTRAVEASSPFMVECLALKEALLHRNKFARSAVIVETDCEVLFRICSKGDRVGSDWRCWDLLDEILALLESVGDVSLSLVSRQGNKVADKLATLAAKGMLQPSWLTDAPSFLCRFLFGDSRIANDDGMFSRGVSRDKEGIG